MISVDLLFVLSPFIIGFIAIPAYTIGKESGARETLKDAEVWFNRHGGIKYSFHDFMKGLISIRKERKGHHDRT